MLFVVQRILASILDERMLLVFLSLVGSKYHYYEYECQVDKGCSGLQTSLTSSGRRPSTRCLFENPPLVALQSH